MNQMVACTLLLEGTAEVMYVQYFQVRHIYNTTLHTCSIFNSTLHLSVQHSSFLCMSECTMQCCFKFSLCLLKLTIFLTDI